MNTVSNDLLAITERLHEVSLKGVQPGVSGPLRAIEAAASEVGKAWSGSWIGHQASVYYNGLRPPPAGAYFSAEWGLMPMGLVNGTCGDWLQYTVDSVRDAIVKRAGEPNLSAARKLAKEARELFDESKSEILSALSTAQSESHDPFVESLSQKVKELRPYDPQDYYNALAPKQFTTRDTLALSEGVMAPPHISVLADVSSMQHATTVCEDLAKVARRAASHLAKQNRNTRVRPNGGANVFIGHGRSLIWRELKDFIKERLDLPVDEFNRVPVAGVTNIARLTEMLSDAAVAFIVLTAEDEQIDGSTRARENVVHEAGLFQGRLGFARAIIVLEEGCNEFSNIAGLGQIRFPKSNIKAVFDEIRRVLEREGLVNP